MLTAGKGAGSRGVTLVELMIAMTLSLLLSLAMVQLFIGNKQTFRILEGSSRLQENGRFAMGFISREMLVAGYTGCIVEPTQINNVLNGNSSALWGFTTAARGFDGGASDWAPDWNGASYTDFDFSDAAPGTDIFTLSVVEGLDLKATQAGIISEGASYGTAPITVNVDSNLKVNDIIYVTDCDRGAIAQLTAVTDAGKTLAHGTVSASAKYPGNAKATIDHAYKDAELFKIRAVSFFIGTGTGGGPALFRRINKETPEELVEGVEDLQVLYGVAEDVDQWGTVTKYLTASEVDTAGEWDKVAAVRISLLLQSSDNLAEQAQTYNYQGTSATAADKRIRREFVTTVAVRNRIL